MSKEENSKPERYNLGDKVIARWVDGKRYPGQIHQVLTCDSYTVLFEDGLQKAVKVNHIEPNLNPVPRSELPFEDAREQRAIHESDICDLIVNCSCGSIEDTGFLIQCEHCLTFQHADCLDIKTDADLLEAITCSSCLNPKGVRESCRYKFDHSWLKDATLPSLIPNPNEPVQANKRIATVNNLLEAALQCSEVVHGLAAKISLKNKKICSSEELKCWSKSWLTTDFENLPKKKPNLGVKTVTPFKVKSKSGNKSRSSTKKKKSAINSCSRLNADDFNLPAATNSNQVAIEKIGGSMDQMESSNSSKSFTVKENQSKSSNNLDEICQKHLDEHIENLKSRLESRLKYIESRIDELEEWYGPDLDHNDVEANRTEFRIALKNLRSNLKTFERIHILIKRLQLSSDGQSNENDNDYQAGVHLKRI